LSKHEEIALLIERYLDGELSGTELSDFEQQLASDDKFVSEVAFHKELREGIAKIGERETLTEQMNAFHSELSVDKMLEGNDALEKEKKVIPIRRRSFRYVAIAASVSLLLTVGILSIYHNRFQGRGQNDTAYSPMDRKDDRQSATEGSAEKSEESSPAYPDDAESRVATAFAVTKDGYLVTSYHVVKDAMKASVDVIGDSVTTFDADIIAADPVLDIALLRITDERFDGFSTIPFVFNKTEAPIGQKVYALGYPKNDIVYVDGPVSAVTGFKSDTNAYQVAIPINPGTSGAPLLNERGEVIGIVTAKNTQADGVSYAVKSQRFLEFIDSVQANTDTSWVPVKLPRKNLLKRKRVTDQVKVLKQFIFIIRTR
jgi:serine protease Do